MSGENLAERFAVPVLFVVPHGQEGGDGWVGMSLGGKRIAQLADGVVLNVLHRPQAAQSVAIERSLGESRRQVQVGNLESPAHAVVGINVEGHAQISDQALGTDVAAAAP